MKGFKSKFIFTIEVYKKHKLQYSLQRCDIAASSCWQEIVKFSRISWSGAKIVCSFKFVLKAVLPPQILANTTNQDFLFFLSSLPASLPPFLLSFFRPFSLFLVGGGGCFILSSLFLKSSLLNIIIIRW